MFRLWLQQNEALKPFTPQHILPRVHEIIPKRNMERIPYQGEPEVIIYRTISPDDPNTDINPGDWVALSKEYAQAHKEMRGEGKILEKRVPAEHVSWAGTDENEWFYTP